MADRVTSMPACVLKWAGWTLTIVLVLYTADRLFMPRPRGWYAIDAIEHIPERVAVPAYFPETLNWPPARAYHRRGTPGWWYEIRERSGQSRTLWVGSGGEPWPPALGELGTCLTSPRLCPTGWYGASFRVGTDTLHVVTNIPAGERDLIIHGLDFEGK